MRYLSVCSGIEAATVAWEPLGWTPVGFSEIEPFPSDVLAHHYPGVTNYGDLTNNENWPLKRGDVDIIVGGTPCQAFSVAGLRGGLADARGNLSLVFCRMVDRLRPRWVIWENVPGVLSSGGGRDFGSILGALVECGYGVSYRVLDAQYFGVPQRRRRVFLVGHLGDWRPSAAVLFEPESVRGDSAAKPEARGKGGKGTSIGPKACAGGHAGKSEIIPKTPSHWDDPAMPHPTLGHGGMGQVGYSNQEIFSQRGAYLVPHQPLATFAAPAIGHFRASAVASTVLASSGHGAGETQNPAYVVGQRSVVAPTLTASNDPSRSPQSSEVTAQVASVHAAMGAVRRLTPIECERLQGFPDDYTRIPRVGKEASDCPDGLRYKAIGNSMAVPVMQWLGRRIETVEAVLAEVESGA
jgi:DNA (cytosine-5)-methyltransferase 1